MTYWLLAVRVIDQGAHVPNYEIHTSQPAEGKMIAIRPGEYVDAYKCFLSEDGSYITANLFQVSNTDGVLTEKQTESFFIERA
jgi:hypothetical protein